jgi:hypothetical protein
VLTWTNFVCFLLRFVFVSGLVLSYSKNGIHEITQIKTRKDTKLVSETLSVARIMFLALPPRGDHTPKGVRSASRKGDPRIHQDV